VTGLSFRESTRVQLRDRLLDAAQTITVESGWAAVTMAKIADAAGVSRQTVYNEFGNKADLAEELVNRELGRFLEVVRSRLLANDEVVAGVTDACEGALSMAGSSPLLKAALDLAQSSTNELLPLLTTESQALIDTAVLTVEMVINDHYGEIGLGARELHLAADAIVRLVLSHIMRPSGSPADAAAQIGWVAGQTLRRT
jgi:AcrR family transcriptional regulator